ncbi:MAG: hypothetical protein J6X22_05480 [Muribaculaceae bacterium]|nr:hypothetical protein [Muribaculaceae bacterium]
MELLSDIEKILSEGGVPEQQWVDEVRKQYPYFALPLLLQLKHNGDDNAMQRLAVMSPDRRDLAIVVGKAPAAFAHFYPTEDSASPNPEEAIDLFLNNFAGESNQKEIDALNNAIFNPTPDYADILAAQHADDAPDATDKQDKLIDSFIAHSRRQEQETIASSPQVEHHIDQEEVEQVAHDSVEESTQNDSSMLSESLAKMYIARHKYSKALEIIESINLNFPEKSIYFADQIRFLRKIVLNENIKNKL